VLYEQEISLRKYEFHHSFVSNDIQHYNGTGGCKITKPHIPDSVSRAEIYRRLPAKKILLMAYVRAYE
jgi:hypothetical protein